MAVKRADVNTKMFNPELGMVFSVPVFYTDELKDSASVFDLIYESAHGRFLPYLFVGYFTDGKDFRKWYFANARRHEEMRQAIESEIGGSYSYTYGQIWLDNSTMRNGVPKFDKLVLNEELPNQNEAKTILFDSIEPKYLDESFYICTPREIIYRSTP